MIEVGEYIRDKEGNITKIINTLSLFKDVELYLGEDGYQYSDNTIIKHSKNIIDLIEVGDYVNGQLVRDIVDDYTLIVPDKDGYYEEITIDEIKTILTKELFEANCYKVKEE